MSSNPIQGQLGAVNRFHLLQNRLKKFSMTLEASNHDFTIYAPEGSVYTSQSLEEIEAFIGGWKAALQQSADAQQKMVDLLMQEKKNTSSLLSEPPKNVFHRLLKEDWEVVYP